MRIYKSTIQLLRIPFSLNLLPIFLFALYTAYGRVDWQNTVLIFFLIHFIFYPASNAYNSYMDADEGAIAGIKDPPKPTKQLFQASVLLDFIGILASLYIGIGFTIVNIFLMILSRLYSYRKVRLKQYGLLAFLIVSLTQGGVSFVNMYFGMINESFSLSGIPWQAFTVATLFVGAIYPITQIYQHDEDRKDNVNTISMMVGKRGTFLISGVLFLISFLILYYEIDNKEMLIFTGFMLVPISFFFQWMIRSWKRESLINYTNTMIMAISAAIAMNLAFLWILMCQYL